MHCPLSQLSRLKIFNRRSIVYGEWLRIVVQGSNTTPSCFLPSIITFKGRSKRTWRT